MTRPARPASPEARPATDAADVRAAGGDADASAAAGKPGMGGSLRAAHATDGRDPLAQPASFPAARSSSDAPDAPPATDIPDAPATVAEIAVLPTADPMPDPAPDIPAASDAGTPPRVGIVMGSTSDWPTMREAAAILDALGVAHEDRIVSAHRTPDRLWSYAAEAAERGVRVIVAGAGGAAHLPGMLASKTALPVIGVPIRTEALAGVDSLYSIVQMPRGFPVATMAIGAAGAANGGLMAAAILALSDPALAARLAAWRAALSASIPDEPG